MAHSRAVFNHARHASFLTSALLYNTIPINSVSLALRPTRLPFLDPSRCSRRSYSDARKTSRIMDRMPTQEMKMKAPSMAGAKIQENMDVGVIPMTLVPPTGSNQPTRLGSRFKLFTEKLKYKLKAFAGLVVFNRMQPDKKKRSSITSYLRHRPVISAAESLQTQMYTALANGDTIAINKLCCRGLADDLLTRIVTRPGGARFSTRRWRITQQLSKPKLISDRASQLPMGKTAIRQAVVRLHSRQLLEKLDATTGAVLNRNEQDVLEYLVIQKLLYTTRDATEESEWRVWGTVKETTFEKYMYQVKFPLQAMKAAQGQAQIR